MSKQFIVTWQIECSSDSAEEAATIALDVQRDVDNPATYFEVEDVKTGEIFKFLLETRSKECTLH